MRTAVLLLSLSLATVAATSDTSPCKMAEWVPWTKCSEECDCGLMQRTREILDDAGDMRQCPHDAEASTCNCDPCDEVKKKNPSIKLPASSSHGFTPAEYKPSGGFPTDYGCE